MSANTLKVSGCLVRVVTVREDERQFLLDEFNPNSTQFDSCLNFPTTIIIRKYVFDCWTWFFKRLK